MFSVALLEHVTPYQVQYEVPGFIQFVRTLHTVGPPVA